MCCFCRGSYSTNYSVAADLLIALSSVLHLIIIVFNMQSNFTIFQSLFCLHYLLLIHHLPSGFIHLLAVANTFAVQPKRWDNDRKKNGNINNGYVFFYLFRLRFQSPAIASMVVSNGWTNGLLLRLGSITSSFYWGNSPIKHISI